jgi:hypothetical protein
MMYRSPLVDTTSLNYEKESVTSFDITPDSTNAILRLSDSLR